MKKTWQKVLTYFLLVVSVGIIGLSFVGINAFMQLELDRFSSDKVIVDLFEPMIGNQAKNMARLYLTGENEPFEVGAREFDPKITNFQFIVYGKNNEVLAKNTDSIGGFKTSFESRVLFNTYTIDAGVNKDFPVWDNYKFISIGVGVLGTLGLVGLGSLLVGSAILGIACIVIIFKSFSRDGLGILDQLPLEVFIILGVLAFEFLKILVRSYYHNSFMMLAIEVLRILIIVKGVHSLIVRFQSKTLVKNTLTYHVYEYVMSVYDKLPLIWQGLLAYGILTTIEFFIVMAMSPRRLSAFLLWVFKVVVVGVLLIRVLLDMRTLETSAEIMSLGNIDFKVNEYGLLGVFRKHARSLNRISHSVEIAVEEQMKSERMKTELITNVSHDIKTPLTSIINYVDLLKKEDLENDVARSYLEPLDRQSQKLAKLVDDLMVASQVTSGNAKVNLESVELNVMVDQTAGEFIDRLGQENLELVVSGTDQAVFIKADPGMLSRILDNLLTNVLKYSLAGTRAYLSLDVSGNEVSLTLRNISREILNVDNLTERFVRGDSSRNTEGNGLGLSIAKSMVELMGGRFEIVVDGDLFKVMCIFENIE